MAGLLEFPSIDVIPVTTITPNTCHGAKAPACANIAKANQFDKYIENNEILLGNQPIYRDEIKKFKAVVGEDGKVKLVEIVE